MPNNLSLKRNFFHTALGEHENDKRWCAWVIRMRNGKLTKVPFFNYTTRNGRRFELEARSNDPTTWLTLAGAARVAEAIGGGIGILLGISDLVPGFRLGGIDYDTCIGDDGALAWWAAEANARMHTYTEVSPSGM